MITENYIIKGIRPTEKDFNENGYIWIYQENFNRYLILKEYTNGKIQDDQDVININLSPLFENYKTWKFGIYTKQYCSVFLSAFAFKEPVLYLTIPNILLSLKITNSAYYLNALVFSNSEESSINLAQKFRKDNRKILFELSGNYKEIPLHNSPSSFYQMILDIKQSLDRIEKTTSYIAQNTNQINADVQVLSDVVNKIGQEVNNVREELKAFQEEIKELKDIVKQLVQAQVQALHMQITMSSNTQNTTTMPIPQTDVKPTETIQPVTLDEKQAVKASIQDQALSDYPIIVLKPGSEGIYTSLGEKVNLILFNKYLKYLKIDMNSFNQAFGVHPNDEAQKKLMKLISQKFEKKIKVLNTEDVMACGVQPMKKGEWTIKLSIDNKQIERLVKIFKQALVAIPNDDLTSALHSAIREATSKNEDITLEKVLNYIQPKFKPQFEKVIHLVKGNVDTPKNGPVYVSTQAEEYKEFLISALAIDLDIRYGIIITP